MPESYPFLGRGWSFPPTFHQHGEHVEMTEGVDDIQRSLEILLATGVGERVMQPRYGCAMDRLLFEPIDTALRAYMKDLVRTAVLYFEPRIILDDLALVPVPEAGRIDVTLTYTVAATNTRYNFVYPFYLNEGIEIPASLRPGV